MTEEIDPNAVSRVRKYVTLRASQVWKDLGNFTEKFAREKFLSLWNLLNFIKKFVDEDNLIPPWRSVYLND
jgi:hypothetical protein